MKPPSGLVFLALALVSAGCGRHPAERIEWTTMGTVAAVQLRGDVKASADYVGKCQSVCRLVTDEFNVHDPTSRLHALEALPEPAALASASPFARPCYEAAFSLARASGGAFDPRWRGPGTLDFGAIAKGYAIDRMAQDLSAPEALGDVLLDLGGNLKAVRGTWRAGVKDPSGDGVVARVALRPGEALATSAEYFRGKHIYDARTGRPVSNEVASVTVLCGSALWADGLSTALFVLGPAEGVRFLDLHRVELTGDGAVSVLWLLKDARRIIYGEDRFN